MEHGFVMGRAPGGNLVSATIAWLPESAKPYERGYTSEGENLWDSGPFIFTKRSRFPAFRCADCKLVEFDYSHQEYPPESVAPSSV